MNRPSGRALRYGFSYEGLFRQHMVVKGLNRDTAWYSILDSEWPVRAAAFERWLAPGNFDAQGRQIISLSDLNRISAVADGVVLRRAGLADVSALTALTDQTYLPNEAIIGVTAIPRTWNYDDLVRSEEIWLAETDGRLDAALVLKVDGAFTLSSIAVAPHAQGRKLGEALLAFTETRAPRPWPGQSAALHPRKTGTADQLVWPPWLCADPCGNPA